MCIYSIFVYIFAETINKNTMTTNEIILMLDAEQAKLYEALQNAKLVFGEDSEAAKLARARWVTAVDMLSLINSKNQ